MQIFNPSRLHSNRFVPYLDRWDIRFIGGHLRPSTPIAGGPYAKICSIRDPASHLVSSFCYAHAYKNRDKSYSKFFARRSGRSHFTASDVREFFQTAGDNPQVRFYGTADLPCLDQSDLDRAKAALDSAALILLCERMPESIDIFRNVFGVSHRHFGHHNPSDRKLVSLNSSEIADLVERFAAFDQQLYLHGTRLWQEKHRAIMGNVTSSDTAIIASPARRQSLQSLIFKAKHKDLTEWNAWIKSHYHAVVNGNGWHTDRRADDRAE